MKYFDKQQKKIISFICLGTAVLWIILWNIFPLEFYSLFFASSVGSNVMLILLELVLLFPMNFLFSKLAKGNFNMIFSIISDIVCMTALAYTYSIFRYSAVYIVIFSAVIHFVLWIFIIGNAYEGKDVVIPPIKRNFLRTAGFAAAHTAALDGVFLLLFTVIARKLSEG